MNILVIRTSAMGDVAITVPVIKAIIKQNPTVKITFISQKKFEPFFKDIPNFSFLPIETKNKHKGLKGIYRLYKELKMKKKIDAVADLHNVLRSIILCNLFKLSGYQVAFIDKGRKEKKALIRKENKILKPLKTSAERYADVFRKLGLQVNLKNELPAKLDLKFSKILFKKFGKKTKKWIGIAPFAQYKGKMYPLYKMKNVITFILKKYDNAQIFLFGGGKSEITKLKELKSHFDDNVKSVAGQINLKMELEMISLLDVMISMDSSNMHMASLVGTPVISIWGVTHPYAGFYGFGQNPNNAVQVDLPYRPCSIFGKENYPDKDPFLPMNLIQEKDIIQKIEAFLK